MSRKTLAIAAIVSVVVPLSACGANEEGKAGRDESGARTITGYGLSIEIPAGWDGRVSRDDPSTAPQIIAANFPVPAAESHLGSETAQEMGPASLYIWIADLGSDRTHLQPGRWTEASLPITVGQPDLVPFEGVSSPSEAVRWLVIDDRALLAIVGFGTEEPTDSLLTEANRVLASFRVTKSR